MGVWERGRASRGTLCPMKPARGVAVWPKGGGPGTRGSRVAQTAPGSPRRNPRRETGRGTDGPRDGHFLSIRLSCGNMFICVGLVLVLVLVLVLDLTEGLGGQSTPALDGVGGSRVPIPNSPPDSRRRGLAPDPGRPCVENWLQSGGPAVGPRGERVQHREVNSSRTRCRTNKCRGRFRGRCREATAESAGRHNSL